MKDVQPQLESRTMYTILNKMDDDILFSSPSPLWSVISFKGYEREEKRLELAASTHF